MAKKNSGDINKDSLKAVEDFIKKTEQAKKNVNAIDSAFGNIATQLFGISGASFFKDVPKTTEEIIKQKQELSNLSQDVTTAYEKIGDTISGKFKDIEKDLKNMSNVMSNSVATGFKDIASSINFDGQISSMQDIIKLEEKFKNLQKESGDDWNKYSDDFSKFEKLKTKFEREEKKYFKESSNHYEEILKDNKNFLDGLNKQEKIQALMQIQQKGINGLVEEQSVLLKDIVLHSKGFVDSEKESVISAEKLSQEFSKVSEEAFKSTKQVFSLADTFKSAGKNLSSDILPRMLEFDQAISDAGRDFGFVDAKSADVAVNMTQLNVEAARFGVSVGDALKMMGDLGDELNTINQSYLADSAKEFVSIQKAIGISSKELSTVAGEMMRTGKSAKDVKKYMEGANKVSKMFGVNTKKVMEGIANHLQEFNEMGFSGGEESLTRMIASATRLNMKVDDVFNMSKKARSIEGALDMAAELQLAGGSFAAINPMDLLAAARKGPEEMRKILAKMGSDIGTMNDKGEFTIDAIDADRLQMAADAAGVSVTTLKNSIQKNAETSFKSKFLPDNLQMGEILDPFGKPFNEESLNNMIADSVDMDGVVMEGSLLDKAGIKDVKNMTGEQARNAILQYQNDQKTLEQQAEANQSFQESITAFKDGVMNLFTIFEPFISVLTSFIQVLNSNPILKGIAAGLLGLMVIGPKLVGAFGKFKEGSSAIMDSVKGFKERGIKGVFGGESNKMNTAASDPSPKGSKKGGGLETLAKGLQKMGGKGVLKGIGNLALVSPVLVIFTPAIIPLMGMAVIGKMGKLVEEGFRAVASGISKFGQYKGIYKGIGALALSGPAMLIASPGIIAFSIASVLSGGGILLEMLFRSLARGLGALGSNFSSVAKGAIALVLVGASLIPFAFAAQIMSGVDWLNVLAGVGVMALVVLGLIGLGALLMGPQILFLLLGVATLIAVGASLLIASVGLLAAGTAFQKLAEVNWDGLSGMGLALMSSIPGLLAFSLASMAFLNPLTILGIIAMTATLGGLVMVMVPLASSLDLGANSLDRFANGLDKLQKAANSLDFEKLESLKELSMSLAVGSSGGAMGDNVDKIAEAILKLSNSGGSGGKSGTQKIQIDLKLNGRDLQSFIIKDTEIVT